MIALPSPLSPWRTWLAWFDETLAAELGKLLLRLHPLLGHAGARARHGDRDLEGLDDLRLRGPYERLVLSEWALADALPDEFLRRAAHNEHLFLAPRLVARRSERRLIAVFDAGPAQWGAPRLVHVAMWILLAQRAQAQGAHFSWGFANAPAVLHEEVSPEALQRLLKGRTHELMQPAALRAWQEHFAGEAPRAERWLMSRRIGEADVFTHHAATGEDFEGGLDLRIGPRRALRDARLERPAPRQAAWLLRGHFSLPRASAQQGTVRSRLALRQPPVWSASGRHLALPLLGERCVVVFTLPGAKQRKRSGPRYIQWREGADLTSGALSEIVFGGLVTSARGSMLWNLGRFPLSWLPADEVVVRRGTAHWLSCAWLNGGSPMHRFLLLDHAHQLHAITGKGDRTRIARDVLSLVQVDAQNAVFAHMHDSRTLALSLFRQDGDVRLLAPLPVPDVVSAVHVLPRLRGAVWDGTVCAELRRDTREDARAVRCLLFRSTPQGGYREYETMVAAAGKVIGVLAADGGVDDGLLVLRADRRALLRHDAQRVETLYESAHDIPAVSMSRDGTHVAVLDLSGQLTVLADGGRSVRFQVTPGREPDDG